MGFVIATTAGLVAWLVLWSLGAKSIDAFMITTVIVLLAIMVRTLAPSAPGYKKQQ